jgi:hypothetical protein
MTDEYEKGDLSQRLRHPDDRIFLGAMDELRRYAKYADEFFKDTSVCGCLERAIEQYSVRESEIIL